MQASATILLFLLGWASCDDFGFDLDDLEVEISSRDVAPADLAPPLPPRKLKGVPDVTAEAGKILRFQIPGDAFVGNIDRIEVKSPLPPWLSYTPSTRTFVGLPLSTDKTDVLVSVAAYGAEDEGIPAHSIFRVHVRRQPAYVPCSNQALVLTIYLDKKLEVVKPQQRVTAMENLAQFLGINISAFTLGGQKHYSDTADSNAILAGPGNVKKRSSKSTSSIDLLVGCSNKLFDQYISLPQQLREQAADGTIAEVIGLPVLSWRVETPSSGALERGRRQTPSEDDFAEYYDEYDDYGEEDIEEDDEGITTIVPKITESSTTSSTTPAEKSEEEMHPHRHHHGELPKVPDEEILSVKEEETTTVLITTSRAPLPATTQRMSTVTERESTTKADSDYYTIDEDDEDPLDYDESETEVPVPVTEPPVVKNTYSSSTSGSTYPSSSSTITSTSIRTTTVEDIPSTELSSSSRFPIETTSEATTTEKLTTIIIPTYFEERQTTEEETVAFTTSTEPTTTSTTVASTTPSTSTTTVPPTTTTEVVISTTTEEVSTTPMTTTEKLSTTPTTPLTTSSTSTTVRTTEFIDVPRNFPPIINQRLKKIRITAGTVLSYFIPEDSFTDSEDGTNLVLKFLDSEGLPLKKTFWIQFNERTREIYGLPLEEHVSKWEFIIEATDKEGASVKDTLEVTVQQHKGRRAVTHEFSLLMRVEKKHEFPTAVDWQLRTLRGLASLFHNKDLTQIVVRQIDLSSEFVTFTWTNDTLPRSYCPKSELDHLLNLMVANKDGDPSFALSQVLAPELRVKNVEYRGIGQCEEKPEPPVAPPKASPTNFSPIPRNQVDHINAVVGELLVFRVPDDTFYDPEDGDARNLKMSLLTIDRQPLPADHWLQFDVKNQEFFGVPLNSDIGRSEYQLVCEDRGGLTANDGLVVVVNAGPRVRYNVEFSMTIEMAYETFINSASSKRKFVEKLRDLFKDKDTSHIRISSIVEGSTIVSWNNKSLTTDRCPDKEIKRLRQVLVNDDETYADRVEVIMGPEFPVSAISLTPIGVCQGEFTVVHPPPPIAPIDEHASADASDEYLITFVVPAVIIAAMIVSAGVVACVLYRRRRTGKMNVEDDERLNNFRSKGIPVIFQDEIDEKPESGTKAPVILKEEKPPLAPPEYSKSATPVQPEDNDAPYQPPPPFATSQEGRQPRPKPTPTYRKPPPYVPP